MRYFLLDASALAAYYLRDEDQTLRPIRHKLIKLFALIALKKITAYVPNFCMAECSKAFAYFFFRKKYTDYDKAKNAYEKTINALLGDVLSTHKQLIYSYELKREHLENIEEIFLADYKTKSYPQEKHLSGIDALVIAMAKELATKHGQENSFLITKDNRMAKVCNLNPDGFTKALHLDRDAIPSF